MARARRGFAKRRTGTATAQVGLQLLDGDKLLKQLETLQREVQQTVAREAVEAGLKPIESRIRTLTPESTDSRERQSKTSRQRWSGSKKLKTTIRSVVRERKRAGIAAGFVGLAGPSYTDGGGHGNLFTKDHKRSVYWGRDGGTIRNINQFVKRAADESAGTARAAVTQTVKQGIDTAARATRG